MPEAVAEAATQRWVLEEMEVAGMEHDFHHFLTQLQGLQILAAVAVAGINPSVATADPVL